MNVVFFLYEKFSGIIFLLLPSVPDNDFETTGQIWHMGDCVARGLKWENVDFEIIDPIDIDPFPEKYIFSNGEIQVNPNYQEELEL